MLPFALALLFTLTGAALICFYRRTHRPSGDALDRMLDMRVKWGGITAESSLGEQVGGEARTARQHASATVVGDE